jgi:hypothetical protein
MASLSPTRPRVKPAVAWRRPVVWPCVLIPGGQQGEVEIDGTPYAVCGLSTPFDEDEPHVTYYGLRLVKPDGTAYDIDFTHMTCDCPDCTFRARDCKHILATADVLVAFGRKDGAA